MTVYEFAFMFLECDMMTFVIFDGDDPNGIIYNGNLADMPIGIRTMEVCSIDNPMEENSITFNVQSEQ